MMNLLFGVCLGLAVGVYVGAWAYERLRTKPSEYAAALHEARYFTPAEAQAIRRLIEKIRAKEKEMWKSKKAKPMGAFAIALMLDGYATDLAIAIGDYPPPRGREKGDAE